MPVDKNKQLQASILDRLLDDNPAVQVEAAQLQQQKINELRDSVRRDLEYLLNTRCRLLEPPEYLPNCQRSLLNYGLPDLATVNILDIEKKREFIKSLEALIMHFEPRFKSVRVKHLDNRDKTDRTLRFRIDATLYADPVPETVVFDSVLEPVMRTVTVEDSIHG